MRAGSDAPGPLRYPPDMRVAVFSTKPYDQTSLSRAAEGSGHELDFFEARLCCENAPLAAGYPAVCAFVHDELNETLLRELARNGTRFVALRAAGFNNVDLEVARELGIRVGRVPAYSPYAVAEHAAALILSLVRRTHRAYNRVRDGNFALEGLLGFDLHGRCVGIVGSGRIGTVFARIMSGFGCRLMAYDPYPNEEMRSLGARYVDLPELFAESDIIALHAPLTSTTHHLVDRETLALVKPGVIDREHQPWRPHRHRSSHRGAQGRSHRLPGPRRLRGGGRPRLLPGPQCGHHLRRYLRAPV